MAVVGLLGGEPVGKAAAHALEGADLVVGGRHQLDACRPLAARTLAIERGLGPVLDAVEAEPGRVCVLASGDPGFFGVVRVLAERFGPEALEVHPAPSSVALAFARLGLPWDDAVVVTAHGRPLAAAARRVAGLAKAAVLVSPESPPEALGKELLELGAAHSQVAVCSRLGTADERVERTDLSGLANGTWDPLSVVVLIQGVGVAAEKPLAWGLPDRDFEHRAGMITKSEVRAVALAKLALPADGVMWDVGAGSGSISVECAALRPHLSVLAVERRADDAARVRSNAAVHGVAVRVVEGEAPAVLDALPDPDRAFVGGGGLPVLDAVLRRLRPGGRVVATYAAMDRASTAMERLGSLVQLGVVRGERLPDGGVRLAGQNPVFLAWGPDR
ncbi:MAG: precorrin-6y C5,15-methyltransferase (decarboxylating) subunit CbiE [Actinomycetota bacterium]|nr:precorrin-6y C5,15-methyltransferase (decarboxylating) subunit CbiE [Actinomycetota bacterium]